MYKNHVQHEKMSCSNQGCAC